MSRDTQIQQLFYETLMESQYWPAERLREHQRQQLGRLLRHARAEVPFYKDRLDGVLDADGELDWDRWRQIPILRREDLLVHRDAMQAQHLPAGHGEVVKDTTNGSTGTPIRISHSRYSSNAQAGAIFRYHQWHGLDWQRDVLLITGADPAEATLPDGERGHRWGPPWLPEATGRTIRLNPFIAPADVLDFIAAKGIAYLTCRPKVAQALALEAIRQGRRLPIDAVLGFGTAVQSDEAEDCRRAFGARMISIYSSTEALLIAHRCPDEAHLHINDEQVLVELLDADDHPVAPGEIGRVIVTPLFGFAQPLLRYDQGDLAIAAHAKCSCGRTLGVIERIAGRQMHLFRFPDGTRIAPKAPEALRAALGAKYWQLAQITPLGIEVRYVPFEGSTADVIAATVLVRSVTHPAVEVSFRQQPDLVRIGGGKYIEYVYEAD